jgi:hypothetical protein
VTLLSANDVQTVDQEQKKPSSAARRPQHAVCTAPLPCIAKSELFQAAPEAAVVNFNQRQLVIEVYLIMQRTGHNREIRQHGAVVPQAYRCYARIPPQHVKTILVTCMINQQPSLCQELVCRIRYKHFNRPTPS